MVPLSWLKEPNHLTGECKIKNEQIKEITSKAIEQLIAAVNEGQTEALTQYLAAIGRFIDLFPTRSSMIYKSLSEGLLFRIRIAPKSP